MDRESHFLTAPVGAEEGGQAWRILECAMHEIDPPPEYEADVRAVFAADMAIHRRNGPVNEWVRLEQHFHTKEDERIWRDSIADMRRAVAADPTLESVKERSALLAALVDVKLDARCVKNFVEEHDNHLELSNHAMEMYIRREDTRSTGDLFSPGAVIVSNERYLSEQDFAMIARMVSKEGMDQDLRRLAIEAGRTMENVALGWGERGTNGNPPMSVSDHTLAVAHREMMKSRRSAATMAQQAGMGMQAW